VRSLQELHRSVSTHAPSDTRAMDLDLAREAWRMGEENS